MGVNLEIGKLFIESSRRQKRGKWEKLSGDQFCFVVDKLSRVRIESSIVPEHFNYIDMMLQLF